MVVARQEPAWVARSSYYASLYSAQQASPTATEKFDNDDDQQPNDSSGFNDKAGSVFSAATDLAFRPTTATLEGGAKTMTSLSDSNVQSLTSTGVVSSTAVDSVMQSLTTPSMTTSMTSNQPGGQSVGGTYAPSAINTASSSGTNVASLTPSLDTQRKAHHGPSTTVIAGVVIPIVLLLASGLVALTCLRRRRRRVAVLSTDGIDTTDNIVSINVARPMAMVEKVAEKKVNVGSPSPNLTTTMLSPIDEAMATPQHPRPIITSPQNPTYFTGLDTFSVHSAATSEDPPPPYRARSMLSHTSSQRRQPSITTTVAALAPASPISPAHLASPFSDANTVGVSRSPSQRSFASTLYSETASVYEARAARRSTGPAEYTINRTLSTGDDVRVRSPFEDPEDASDAERSNEDRSR
ncbi:hypothetical protein E4T38_00513 [Aureobasidium subglaciale]|nr:hypothetical protein E4T38_00513 [Aureobasidium subglaciale]KAI5231762.1 hypothetical protein E4T40_00390 [Aureobasidium subglaciale]KAI5234544.1 hypothetical protein E4T41_00512 [Aureobasidium subglaciale]KAI5267900.1 hypothetical protein E4T46_00512 [Aureobasidium subglaciale]